MSPVSSRYKFHRHGSSVRIARHRKWNARQVTERHAKRFEKVTLFDSLRKDLP
jgi:hypothetical protein